ncbi:MAG: hypothetical protein JSS75_12905 [Bacteroidetes bacterium]|nr:hypothetical protein [Bacteroidota bacterium]
MKNTHTQSKQEFYLALALIAIGIGTRLLCNVLGLYNFSAVGATAIFAGAFLRRNKWSYAIPLVATFLTDLVIGLYGTSEMLVVYGSYVAMMLVGSLYAKKPSLLSYVGVALGGSAAFFLVTNFALWPFYAQYPHTFAGVIESYTMALPFYRNSFASDMIFSAILFVGYESAKVFVTRGKQVAAQVGA